MNPEDTEGKKADRGAERASHGSIVALRWLFRCLLILLVLYVAMVWAYFSFWNSGVRSPSREQGLFRSGGMPPKPKVLPGDQAIRVLSIDGGGVKGLLPLQALKNLEKRTGRPSSELFDFMVGTSTGGIIVSSLALADEDGNPKWSANDLIDQYMSLSEQTFSVSWLHRILTVGGIIGTKLESTGLDRLLRKHYGDVKMSQLNTAVVIPSFDIGNNTVELFSSRNFGHKDVNDYHVSDVVGGITAAPIYFRPVSMTDVAGNNPRTVVDASLFTNNPVLLGAHLASEIFPNRKSVIVSLGTGEQKGFTQEVDPSYWGLFQWARVLYPVAARGDTILSDWIMRMGQDSPQFSALAYYRVNQPIELEYNTWVLKGQQQLDALNATGRKMVQENGAMLEELSLILVDPSLSNIQENVKLGDPNWTNPG